MTTYYIVWNPARNEGFVTTDPEDADYVREALEVGALGYVLKPRMASDLIPSLNAALAGKQFISPSPVFDELLIPPPSQ